MTVRSCAKEFLQGLFDDIDSKFLPTLKAKSRSILRKSADFVGASF